METPAVLYETIASSSDGASNTDIISITDFNSVRWVMHNSALRVVETAAAALSANRFNTLQNIR